MMFNQAINTHYGLRINRLAIFKSVKLERSIAAKTHYILAAVFNVIGCSTAGVDRLPSGLGVVDPIVFAG